MAGPKLRRKFRVVLVAEGDSWEAAGEAVTHALIVLQRGDPAELKEDGTPFEVKAANIQDTCGWKVEISRDEGMTHEAYVDLKRQAHRAGGTEVAVGEVPGAPEGDSGSAP